MESKSLEKAQKRSLCMGKEFRIFWISEKNYDFLFVCFCQIQNQLRVLFLVIENQGM